MSAPPAAMAKGWGSFQSPSVELLIHQSDADYRAPTLPAFVSDFPLPHAIEASAKEDAAAAAAADDSAVAAAAPPSVFGRAACLTSLFLLDPRWTFINHGAFGATLRPLLHVRNAWSEYMEQQPLRFLDRELLPLLVHVTREMAALVGCAPTNLTLHANATTALNVLFRSFSFTPKDKVLRLNIAYGAVKKMVASTGASVVEVDVPLPLRSRGQLVDAVAAALDSPQHAGQFKLAVFDQIASNSAILLPIDDLVALCHARGVPVLIDGAHALGSVPLALEKSGVDYFVSNAHKWLCNPKGAAILYVAPHLQKGIKPLVISHGIGSGFTSDFIWTGCQDYAPLLTLLSTLRLWKRIGGIDRARKYNHFLVMRAGRYLAKLWGTELLVGNGDASDESDEEADALTGNMICVRLPGPLDPVHDDEHNEIQNRLHFEHGIEVPIKVLGTPPRLWIRISTMIYNEMRDYERVGEVVWNMRGGKSSSNGIGSSAVAAAQHTELKPTRAAAAAAAPAVMLRPDHTQVCIPPGADSLARARDFYCGVLQLREVDRPREVQERPGIWLHCGPPDSKGPFPANVHIGCESLPADFYSRTKAHIAYNVSGLSSWKERLRARGYPIVESTKLPGMERFDSRDPFGNKVEFIETLPALSSSCSSRSSDDAKGAACSSAVPYFWHSPRAYSSEPLLRVGVFQGSAVPGNLEANIATMLATLKRAKATGAHLVLFPELWVSGYDISREEMHQLAFSVHSETMQRIQGACKEMQIAVCFGYPELAENEAGSSSSSASSRERVVYNSAVLISEQGSILLSYRKTHLWMAGEKSMFACGSIDTLRVVRLEPHDLRVGINVCYDIEFPEPSRLLAVAGAQLILVPTALAKGEVHQTVPLMVVPARALDNHVWIAYSNLVGRSTPSAKLDFCGLSGIIGPDGQTLRRLGDSAEAAATDARAADSSSSSHVASFPSKLSSAPFPGEGSDLCVHDLLPAQYAKRFETTPLLVDRRPELCHALAR